VLYILTVWSDLLIAAKAAFADLGTTGERQLRKRPQATQSSGASAAKTVKKTSKLQRQACMLSLCPFYLQYGQAV